MHDIYVLLMLFLWISTLLLGLSMSRASKTSAQFSDIKARRFYFLFNILLVVGLGLTCLTPPKHANLQIIYHGFPLMLLPFIHRETALLSTAFTRKTYDTTLMRYDTHCFPFIMKFHDENRWNTVLLSEYLHACYLSFYIMLYGLPLFFYLQKNWQGFYAISFGMLSVLFTTFITHAIVPALGPRTLFEKINDARSHGLFFRLTHEILTRGSTPGTAFPSGHTGVAAVVLCLMPFLNIHLFYAILPFGLGLIISTIYGRFHYVFDLLAGIVYAMLSFFVTYTCYLR